MAGLVTISIDNKIGLVTCLGKSSKTVINFENILQLTEAQIGNIFFFFIGNEGSIFKTNQLSKSRICDCRNDFVGYPFAPIKLDFVDHIFSEIDLNLPKTFNSNFAGLFFQKAYPNSQITRKIPC